MDTQGASAIAESDRRFEIPGIARIVTGNGGLPKVSITAPEASGEMYLHGAHVTSWKPAGKEEMIFLSAHSKFEAGKAIRGGVPICFPWFGGKADDPKAPAHGFVRAKSWKLESIAQTKGAVTVSMFTESNDDTKKWWPADFRLLQRATFASDLTLELEVTNTGKTALRFEEALHTYHRVADIAVARVRGLDAVHYLDKTDSNRNKLQQGEIAIAAETDSVYLNTAGPIEILDPALHRLTRITKQDSRTTVVWNPWIEKARSFSDFGPDEWKQMICIEASNVSDFAVNLAPGQQHKMKALVTIANL
jgi:glucose-6-phosphate 1-epimerase